MFRLFLFKNTGAIAHTSHKHRIPCAKQQYLWNNVKGTRQKASKAVKNKQPYQEMEGSFAAVGTDANYNHGLAIGAHITAMAGRGSCIISGALTGN